MARDQGSGRRGRPRPSAWWWLGAAFITTWAFVLGIVVGQGWLASPRQLAALPLVGPWFQERSAPAPGPLPEPKPKLSFYKELERKASPPSSTTAPPAPPPPATSARSPARPKPPAPATTPPRPPATIGTQPAATPQPARPRYAVQVASFEKESQARRMVDKLRRDGLPAYLRTSRVRGAGLRYRVRVGPFRDFDKAKGLAGRLRLQKRLAAYVTREE